jgi:hypothetical protein
MTDESIDLMQQFVDLYAREDMLCFFDFGIARPGAAEVSGICRISKPKSGNSSLRYLSMVFVVDTPDEQSRRDIPGVFARLAGDSLKAFAPEISEVLAVPAPTSHPENYVHQIDLLLDKDVDLDERFISARLLPAVRNIAGLRTSEMVWWEDKADVSSIAAKQSDGFIDGLKRMFDRGGRARR